MQKVEGSSPFSRLSRKPSKSGGFFVRPARTGAERAPALPAGATKASLGGADRDSIGESRARGDKEGGSDLRRETSRRTKAGPLLRRVARRPSYTPPTESGSPGPAVRKPMGRPPGDVRV